MAELKKMNVVQICDILKNYCDEYCDTQSVVNWKYMNVDNLPLCQVSLTFYNIIHYIILSLF